MANSNDLIIGLESKIQKLVDLHRNQLAALNKLTENNQELKIEIEDYKKKLAEAESQAGVEQLASAISGSDRNSQDIKLKINQMIKEIDKSINLLEN